MEGCEGREGTGHTNGPHAAAGAAVPAPLQAVAALVAQLPPASRSHITGLYRDTLNTGRAQVEQALAAGDAALFQAAAHRIAGAAAMMQDSELSQAVRQMERASREQGLLPQPPAWQAASMLLARTLDWLQSTSPCSRA